MKSEPESNSEIQTPPFLVFHGMEAAVVDAIEDGQMLLGDPELGKEVVHRIPLCELESGRLSRKPLCGNLSWLKAQKFMTHHETLWDPVFQQLPYILEIHRILEKCTQRPSLRIRTRVSPDDKAYRLGYPLKTKGEPSTIVPLTCFVWFTEHYVIFSTPEPRQRLALPSTG
jgi:hypothetical protein